MASGVAKVREINESSEDMRIAWELLVKTKAEPVGPLHILLIDDNLADVRMVTEGLKESLPAARLSVARDGAEGIQFLRHEGLFLDAPRPDLVLLDLRMPRKSGFDVLREIKEDRALAQIPVVVQTCSESTIDVQRAYSLHANSYITKPLGVDEFNRAIRALVEFWVLVAKLPDGKQEWRGYD